MAGAFRIFAKLGFADGASGHISLRDPVNPNYFWIDPYAKHFACITVSDLILVNHEGTPLTATENKVNTAGFIIRSSIHQALNAVCHMHSPYRRAWSTFGKGIEMLNQATSRTDNDRRVPLTTAGPTAGEAAAFFIALERACQTQLLVEHALTHTPGLQKKYVGDEEAAYTKKASGSPAAMYMQFVPEYELICKETEGDFTK
ncbi:predicted protein [Histoplasma capsulatum G186AR]|uniref:Class II aldolase/adducin N-terminal domain-containing protein n=1 Tax=Ajellomyces capsulatus (strain G186AR / H82 / ATCC MYA-2454 / RMSCC 2432) TaxID=447093 RepID=C0NFN1_AJECG|nr:uncharacterized protein HCBG_01697 [Histoplasma capsulatum G186AR]EEH10052.1 predicted protein [Histoplasma capsulatum G186AR]